jgi:hypothetical protein
VLGRGAVVDGLYRYSLWRRLSCAATTRVLFVMLNPSTADASRDDPTLRRCASFARGWGYGWLDVCNLFAYRATDPRELRGAVDPVGPLNDATIAELASRADRVIAAWGVPGARSGRAAVVMNILRSSRVWCLGTTRDGAPRHPLYVRGDTVDTLYRSAVEEGEECAYLDTSSGRR